LRATKYPIEGGSGEISFTSLFPFPSLQDALEWLVKHIDQCAAKRFTESFVDL
jgi:hypothetical protein